jgi:hypothetical protein
MKVIVLNASDGDPIYLYRGPVEGRCVRLLVDAQVVDLEFGLYAHPNWPRARFHVLLGRREVELLDSVPENQLPSCLIRL